MKPKFSIGATVPNIEAQLMDGESFDLNSLKGQFVLINFWGSWCGPCRAENPQWVQLYQEFHGEKFEHATDFEIVSIGIEQSESSWKKAIQQDQMHWKYHILQADRFKSQWAKEYGVREIPTHYLLNEKGHIIGVNMTYLEMKEFLTQQLSSSR